MSISDHSITVGLIVNPIAGMGGSVGLKGTDGRKILEEAIRRGAHPQASQRVRECFQEIQGLKTKLKILTLDGVMGGDLMKEMGFSVEIIIDSRLPNTTSLFETKSDFTRLAAQIMKSRQVALIVFLGGDGTARDLYEAVGMEIPVLGIPGGVKIHSSVFAINPIAAGQLILAFLWGEIGLREGEVLDIDEEAFRDNRVITHLYGYLSVPYTPLFSQPSKMGTPQTEDEQFNQHEIARWIIDEMKQWDRDLDWYYLIGPGTTPRAVTDLLGIEKTLLGVDLMHKGQLIGKDLNEQQILEVISGKKSKLIITPIGAQGFLFGRGNLQLSPAVLRIVGLENILIIATKYKISTLPDNKMRIDSRDAAFDSEFKGYYRVLMDYGQFRIIDVF
jgi:predicted polyphosphate/ATP-dependent NAD kinase